MDDWTDPETARSWSDNPFTHNPTRAEHLDMLLTLLEEEYRPHTTILDIGLGSGLVEEAIFKRIPDAYIVGVDASRAMLELAYARLRGYEGQYEVVVHDLRELETLELPDEDYSVAISVQTIHNVEDKYKKGIFKLVYDALQPGGLFLIVDRIAVDTPALFGPYRTVWGRLDRLHSGSYRSREGSTFEEHTQGVASRGDLPITLEQHLDWLREAGFEVACLHLHGNRALFAARKP